MAKAEKSGEADSDKFERIYQELRVRLAQQGAVASLGQIALRSSDLNRLLQEAAEHVVKNLNADCCEILELLPGEEQLVLRAGTGWKPGYVGKARVSAGRGSQGGYTLKSNKPVILTDLRLEKRFSKHPLLVEHEVISGISVIIHGKDRPYGVLGAFTKSPRNFSDHDTNFLQSVANLLSSAITKLRMESAIRSSRDQLAVILENVAEGLTVQDTKGQLIYVNKHAARMMGVASAEEAMITPIQELVQNFELFNEHGELFPIGRLPGRRALQGEESPSALIGFRILASGEERWSLVRASPVYDSQGQVQFAVNIFQDITELKRAEQGQRFLAEASELLSSSVDYQTTLKNVAQKAVKQFADWCAIHIIDDYPNIRQLTVAHMDPEKESLARELQLKYPPDPLAKRGLYNVLRTGEMEYYDEIADDQLEAAARDKDHLELLRKIGLKSAMILPLISREKTLGAITLVWSYKRDGDEENYRYLAKELARRASLAIENAMLYQELQEVNSELESRVAKRTAQLEHVVQILSDEIAVRKLTEQELEKSKAFLTHLFQSSPDATLLVDPEGKLVQINTKTEMLFGYMQEELVGKSVELLIPERFRDRHLGHRQKYQLDSQQRAMGAGLELFGRRKDGTEFPVDIMLSPANIEGKSMVISVVRDIAEQKRLQAELIEVHHRLTDGLEAERLLLSQELHDNSIQELFGITYQLDSLIKACSQPDIAGELASTMKAAQKVIHDLRVISSELRPPALTSFGLETIIRDHLENFQRRHPDIIVDTELMPDDQHLEERKRLALFRVYQHALSNIVRHAKANHMWVKLKLDTDHVLLEIRDDGKGFQMPTSWVDLARQGHLGLVGTRERVEAIGGRLSIDSSPGEGTLISVDVPLNMKQKNGGNPSSSANAGVG